VGTRAGETPTTAGVLNLGTQQLNLLSNATLVATADNFTAGFGLLAGGSISKSTAIVNGSTLAYIGEGGTVNAGGVDILADSTDTAIAKNDVISAALGVSTTSARSDATVMSRTEAFGGAQSGVVATNIATGINVGSGDIDIDADSTMSATAESKGGGFSGLATVTSFKPFAQVNGATRAYVRDGVDIIPTLATIRDFDPPRLVGDTEEGERIRADIALLGRLVSAYRHHRL